MIEKSVSFLSLQIVILKIFKMSEFINNSTKRLNDLVAFASKLVRGENGKQLIESYQQVLETISPMEAMQVFDLLLQTEFTTEELKPHVGKIMNVFYKSLASFKVEKPSKSHFLSLLALENREVEKILNQIKPLLKLYFDENVDNELEIKRQLIGLFSQLKAYELHYIKKEIILFPYIEKCFPQYRCLQLMWSFHDDYRKNLKSIETLLAEEQVDKKVLPNEVGKLFFVILPIIFREEQIIFPMALKVIPEKEWRTMLHQSLEIGWCYINPEIQKSEPQQAKFMDGMVDLGTGALYAEELILMLENLPVDITFVDENDEVRYFSGAKHRIFPRSKAIIGRKVQNCHPPESVHVVNEIVDAFKSGKKDNADFWIQMKGMFIHIRYFALRDANGNYKGTIEVSQDATGIRALTGERRLLDWE